MEKEKEPVLIIRTPGSVHKVHEDGTIEVSKNEVPLRDLIRAMSQGHCEPQEVRDKWN